jgi:hypothetical protein
MIRGLLGFSVTPTKSTPEKDTQIKQVRHPQEPQSSLASQGHAAHGSHKHDREDKGIENSVDPSVEFTEDDCIGYICSISIT